MTGKRFKLSYPNGAFLIDGDKPLCHMENDLMIVDLLNELAEENQELELWNEKYTVMIKANSNLNEVLSDDLEKVKKENQRLKSRITYLERKIERERNATNKQYEKWEKEALEKITKLEKENAFLTVEVEALKQIKPIKKLPRNLTVLKVDDGDVE